MMDKEEMRLRELAPRDELQILIQEATAGVEAALALEDKGWINLSGTTGDVITPAERITNLKLSRLYAVKDPFGKQAVRLWTDYTFGSGVAWDMEDEKAKKVLEAFWNARANRNVLSASGQRKSSNKLLKDGEVFFAIFLGVGETKIRYIDPLEITEFITDPGDRDDVRFYKRVWSDTMGKSHESIYRSWTNPKGDAMQDAFDKRITKTEDALVYHLTLNTTEQRGNPLLLPALPWMKYHTKFAASRIAISLALARFAWKSKVKGGQAAVDAIKAKTHEKEIDAASHLVENLGVDTTPIKTDTGAQGAYQDGRMIKLQIAAAVGIPEQYFGDISIGNLATAKTVELPMMKMFQSYQQVWRDAYKDIDEIILEHNSIAPDKWYVDRDFPPIAPEDVAMAAKSLVDIITVMPEFAYLPDVQQTALLILGINDPAKVLKQMEEAVKHDPSLRLAKVIKEFREATKAIQKKE